ANLDAICATPGLDGVYIGPADLSYALGLPPRGDNPDPTHLQTCDKIRQTAHGHGIKACMHCASAAFAAGAIKRGFDLIMLTSDGRPAPGGPPPAARRPEGRYRVSRALPAPGAAAASPPGASKLWRPRCAGVLCAGFLIWSPMATFMIPPRARAED